MFFTGGALGVPVRHSVGGDDAGEATSLWLQEVSPPQRKTDCKHGVYVRSGKTSFKMFFDMNPFNLHQNWLQTWILC